MLKIGPLYLDQTPPPGLEGTALLEWLLTTPLGDGTAPGDPTAEALGAGAFSEAWAEGTGTGDIPASDDNGPQETGFSVAHPTLSFEIQTPADADGTLGHGIEIADLGIETGPHSITGLDHFDDFASLAANFEAKAGGGHGLGNDLIFLDYESFAKGGNGGTKGGGGGTGGGGGGGGKGGKGGGTADPGVIDSYVSGPDGGFNVEIQFSGTWTSSLQQAFIDAADWISSTIVGDIADVFYQGSIIDDITIDAELTAIDGVGGILGQAGPTAVRTGSYLPAAAIMQFDNADADTFNQMGLWDEIVQHEMLHSIGFGTIWGYLGLISGSGTSSPTFTGANASLAYGSENGVPIENDGGPGTKESHWEESLFGSELMTGWLDSNNVYISDMTVASLEDLGYDTTWTPDSYAVA